MILTYHHVLPNALPPLNQPKVGEWFFIHSPEGLDQHLSTLKKKGYKIIPLSEMIDHITRVGRQPQKCVALTFDDGWKDNFSYALPVLLSNDVSACFFVDTAHLSDSNQNDRKMNVEQLQEMLRNRMEIGSHTKTHPNLLKLTPEEMGEEIYGSKIALESKLGAKIDYFAYPGGAFNSIASNLVREAGYHAALITIGPGKNCRDNLFWLYRNHISEGMNELRDRFLFCPPLTSLMEARSKRRALLNLDNL